MHLPIRKHPHVYAETAPLPLILDAHTAEPHAPQHCDISRRYPLVVYETQACIIGQFFLGLQHALRKSLHGLPDTKITQNLFGSSPVSSQHNPQK
jgi:hypothetical protein